MAISEEKEVTVWELNHLHNKNEYEVWDDSK